MHFECCKCEFYAHAHESPTDADWRTCDCRCHDAAKQLTLGVLGFELPVHAP